MYKIFSWAMVLFWMAAIFYFSSQPASVSNELSKGVTEVIVEKVDKLTPNKEMEPNRFNHILRKNAHFFNFLVLGILVFHVLSSYGQQGYRRIGLALLLCVVYAITDEVHQLFVPGRGPQLKDVLIDSAGASIGIALSGLFARLIKK